MEILSFSNRDGVFSLDIEYVVNESGVNGKFTLER